MNTEAKLQEIIIKLKDFRGEVEKAFAKLDGFNNFEIQDRIQHFREIEVSKVNRNIEQAIEVLDAPIYVGLLGRYSHGKTALINEFFSIGEQYSLPEGEGVVTSKITLISFDSEVASPRCFQAFRDGTKNRISIETLRASVREKIADINTTVTDYFSIEIPTREPFSRLFEEEKIHLVDMPGLGSPYENDTQRIVRILDHIDLLIVVIKITEIDARAGNAIDRFIRDNLSIPIIPVLTFFDKWEECDAFVACSDEEEVIIKAKQLVESTIPSLSKHLVRAVAVSSKTKFNITELRECVLNFVKEQNIGIGKAKREVPQIIKRKLSEVSRELDRLTIDMESSLTRLQKEIRGLLPKTQESQNGFEPFEDFFRRQKDRAITDGKRKISRTVKDVFSDFRPIVSDIRDLTTYAEVRDRIKNIEQQVYPKKYTELKNDIDSMMEEFKTTLSDAVVIYIDKLNIGESKRQEEKQSALSIIENYSLQTTAKPFEAQSIVGDIVQDIAKSAIDFFIDNLTNPQLLIPLSLPLLTVPITIALNALPLGMGRGLATGLTTLVDSTLIIFAVLFILRVVFSNRTKQFNAAKNNIIDKLMSSFDKHKQEVLNDSCESFAESVRELVREVTDDLQSATDDYSADVKKISEATKIFKSKVSEINGFLQKQIEIFEAEQV